MDDTRGGVAETAISSVIGGPMDQGTDDKFTDTVKQEKASAQQA